MSVSAGRVTILVTLDKAAEAFELLYIYAHSYSPTQVVCLKKAIEHS